MGSTFGITVVCVSGDVTHIVDKVKTNNDDTMAWFWGIWTRNSFS